MKDMEMKEGRVIDCRRQFEMIRRINQELALGELRPDRFYRFGWVWVAILRIWSRFSCYIRSLVQI